LSHAGQSYLAGSDEEMAAIARHEAELLGELRHRTEQAGVAIAEVSVGATPTLRYSLGEPGITEQRPGNYVYFDRTQQALGAASLDDCALTVLATIVSKPATDRMILDCGSKTLTSDAARGFRPTPGYGAVLTPEGNAVDDNFLIERLSEEHATVRMTRPTRLQPGDRVRVLPNHACTVVNMVDCAQLVDGEVVLDTLSISARGKVT
jgi:D-serine deaminase-like pyridoxal phosphate-dependent protein